MYHDIMFQKQIEDNEKVKDMFSTYLSNLNAIECGIHNSDHTNADIEVIEAAINDHAKTKVKFEKRLAFLIQSL